MRVRMLVPMEGPNTSFRPDDIVTFEEAETAQSLIDAGFAEPAEDAPPARRELTWTKPEPAELPGDFGKLNRAELDELARKRGLDLKPFKSKADVIAALEKAAESDLREDGPTITEWVARGYAAKAYPPRGYASKSSDDEIAAAVAAQEAAEADAAKQSGTTPKETATVPAVGVEKRAE